MKNAEKIEMVKDVVLEGWNNGLEFDDICGEVLAARFDGIGFRDIAALVKYWGVEGGFIVDQAKARKNATEHITEGLQDAFDSWDDVEAWAAQITKDFGIDSPNWALNKIKGLAKENEIELPERIEATDWQRAAIKCYLDHGADVSIETLTECLTDKIGNPKGYAKLVYPIIRELAKNGLFE